jgi:ribonuclease HI
VIRLKYYGVKSDTISFICTDWEEAKEKMKGLKNLKYKAFKTNEEALSFINDEVVINVNKSNVSAYIDGSYDDSTKSYSFGGVLIINGEERRFNKKYENDEYQSMRNVAGEIKGAGYIIQYCINHGIKELDLYFDYIGIEKWYKGDWKANSPIALVYVDFANKVKDKIKVNFYKVKSHSNDYYNDLADKLAKDALGIK